MLVVVIMIVRVRMCDHAMCVFMAVRCAGRNGWLMGMIVVFVVVGMLMRMCDVFVGMCVRMLRHKDLLTWSRPRGNREALNLGRTAVDGLAASG